MGTVYPTVKRFQSPVMMHSSNPELEALSRQKIAERQALLSLSPDEAQAIADQTLHPSLWQVRIPDQVWTEHIPTSYQVSQSLPLEALRDLLATIQQAEIELVHLPQTTRQDEKHLRLSILILRAFIMAQLNAQSPRALLSLSEKIVDNLWTEAGLSVWYRYGVQIEDAIPIEAIATLDELQWERFLSTRWPQIQTRLETKRSQYQRLMERLRS